MSEMSAVHSSQGIPIAFMVHPFGKVVDQQACTCIVEDGGALKLRRMCNQRTRT